jgi:four helix bundle protein
MDEEQLKTPTKQLVLRVIELVEAFPPSKPANIIGNQLLKSGTSVGANYRSACRGRSKPDFISKLGIAVEEGDEILYWMELLVEANIMPKERLESLMRETDEVCAILTASSITARNNTVKK